MKKFFIVVAAVFGLAIAANAADYSINDADIDALIECAVESESLSLDVEGTSYAYAGSEAMVSEKNDAVAIFLNFFLGGFGIHRHYMGTAKWMWAAYTFTAGGIFGIIPFVDFIVELVDLVEGRGLGAYYGNPKFIMWL